MDLGQRRIMDLSSKLLTRIFFLERSQSWRKSSSQKWLSLNDENKNNLCFLALHPTKNDIFNVSI